MVDFATSDHPAVQAQLNRLGALSLPQGRFGLETITALLARLGDPHKQLPPSFHVAGTNGKGSTCAFLRAMLEAAGHRVHVFTSPHLVRFNERIRLAGKLIDDAALAAMLAEVLDAAEAAGLNPSFFEVTTAAAFLCFARTPADACVIEVGLGGRFDATNVVDAPVVCGIASLGIDHEAFLLAPDKGVPQQPLARIAFEKAGIAKHRVPLVTMGVLHPPEAREAIAASALRMDAPLCEYGTDWAAKSGGSDAHLVYSEGLNCYFHGPPPPLPGRHQVLNAGLAIAMLRRQSLLPIAIEALKAGVASARWPARLQLLGEGPLTALAPGRKIWLDGGHNADAGLAIARFFGAGGQTHPGATSVATTQQGSLPSRKRDGLGVGDSLPKFHLILGMLANKDPAALIAPLGRQVLSLSVVPVPGHDAQPPQAFAAHSDLAVTACKDVASALRALPPAGDVLIAGSLYLAGDVLRLNDEVPD